jgi:hypothetical protein
MLFALRAQPLEVRQTGAVLGDPLVGELARLDLGEDLLHGGSGLRPDDALAAGHVAILGGVADGVAHVGDAALVDEIDDEFHLVDALEVGHLGSVTGLDQGFEARADELGEPAAQHRLLAEQVGLGFLLESGLDDCGATAADCAAPREADLARVAGRILLHREQARDAAALRIFSANHVAGALGRDHEDVHVGRRLNEFEMDIEAVAEGEVLALGEPRLDLLVVDLGAHLVRHEHHDDVGLAGSLGGVENRQPLLDRLVARGAFGAESHAHIHAAVAQVERVGVALASESDDRDLAAPKRAQVRVAIVINFHSDSLLTGVNDGAARWS